MDYSADRTCDVRADTVVRAFVHGVTPDSLRITRGDAAFAPKVAVAALGGTRLEIVLGGETAATLSFVGADGRHASLHLAPSRRASWLDEATASKAAGKLDDAERQLAGGMAEGHPQHAYALGLLGRIELGRGKIEHAAELLRASMDLHGRSGHVAQRWRHVSP